MENEGGKNRDKKIAMVKLIIQKNNQPGIAATKILVCWVSVWTYSCGICSWYWLLLFWAL
jgi:hypothetical protein